MTRQNHQPDGSSWWLSAPVTVLWALLPLSIIPSGSPGRYFGGFDLDVDEDDNPACYARKPRRPPA